MWRDRLAHGEANGSRLTVATYLHDCGTIVRNGLLAVGIHEEQITPVRTESALDCGLHRDARIDVGDNLTFPLRRIRAYHTQKISVSEKDYSSRNEVYQLQHPPSFSTMIVGVWPAKAIFASSRKSEHDEDSR